MTETLPSSPGNILSKNMLIIKCGELKWNKMGANIKTLVYYFAVFNLLLVKCRYKRTFSLLDIDLLWFSPPNHTVMHTFALHLVEATLAAVTAMTLRVYCMLISALHICTLCLSPFFFENCTAFAKTFPQDLRVCCKRNIPTARWCHWQATWCEWCVSAVWCLDYPTLFDMIAKMLSLVSPDQNILFSVFDSFHHASSPD